MYKNKVFRAILSWAWSCPYFRERGLGWPRRLNPKAIPAPRFSHLPAIAHSFLLAYSYGRNCEQNYAEAFVFCVFFCSFQQTKLPANPLTAFPQITMPNPQHPYQVGNNTRWPLWPWVQSTLLPSTPQDIICEQGRKMRWPGYEWHRYLTQEEFWCLIRVERGKQSPNLETKTPFNICKKPCP